MSRLKDKYPHEPFTHKLLRSLARVSNIQLGSMMKYLYAHKEIMLKNYPLSPSDKEIIQDQWEQMAKVLNTLEGRPRAVSGWKNIWEDYTLALNYKIQDMYLIQDGRPENVPKDTILPLTDLDKWVWTFILGRGYGSMGRECTYIGDTPFEPFPEVNNTGVQNESSNQSLEESPTSSKPWPQVDPEVGLSKAQPPPLTDVMDSSDVNRKRPRLQNVLVVQQAGEPVSATLPTLETRSAIYKQTVLESMKQVKKIQDEIIKLQYQSMELLNQMSEKVQQLGQLLSVYRGTVQ